MKIAEPYVRSGNPLSAILRKTFSNMRGRARLLKGLVTAFPRYNNSSLMFEGITVPLDLRNSAEVNLFYHGKATHEAFFQKILLALVDSNTVFFDVGSNIGYYTFLLGSYVRKIYAFEPNPILNERLKNVVKESGVKKIVIFDSGLSNSETAMTFYYEKSRHDLGSFIKSNNLSYESIVSVTTLDDVIRKRNLLRPDIIKIDVEGYEMEVLEGYEMIIEHKPVILMEWIYSNGVIEKFTRLVDLIGNDYLIFAISRDEMLIPITNGKIQKHNASDLLLISTQSHKMDLIKHWLK